MSKSAKVVDELLGAIAVYREYIPSDDSVEYTTYFRVNDKKYRNDLKIDASEFEGAQSEQEAEDYIRHKILNSISEGNFILSTAPRIPLSEEEKSSVLETLKLREKEIQKMHETTPLKGLAEDSKNEPVTAEELPPPVYVNEPSDSELAIIAILMRLYDLNMALLNHFDSDTADAIYDRHSKGEHLNPPIYIPSAVEE